MYDTGAPWVSRKSNCHNEDGSPKRKYYSRQEAKNRCRKEHTVYRCVDCGYWHIAKRRNNFPRCVIFCKTCGWSKVDQRMDEPFLCKCLRLSLWEGLGVLKYLRDKREGLLEEVEAS